MGCQNSKLNSDIVAIPPKIRPLLWRKLEEIRRRRNVVVVGRGSGSGGTLSKKELLTDGGQEECDLSSSHQSLHENESLIRKNSSVSSSGSQPIREALSDEDIEKSNTEPIKNEKTETNEDGNEEQRSGKDDGKEGEIMEKVVVVVEEEEEETEEGNISSCPGSPSFRIYFIESLANQDEETELILMNQDEEGKNDSTDDKNDKQKKWHRANSVDSIDHLVATYQDQETKIIKKRGKHRMRITRAICRGPVAVKHLLSVKSCYHPSDEGASLINRKSAH